MKPTRPPLEIVLPYEGAEETVQYFGPEYAEAMTGHTVEACVRLGLHPHFTAIFENYMKDLHLVVLEGEHQEVSKLDVQRLRTSTSPEEDPQWRRLLIVGSGDIKAREGLLHDTIAEMPAIKTDEEQLRGVCHDWIFYEQAVIAMSTACHMQRTFDRYIPDFNGQNPYYRSEYAVSTEYVKATGKELDLYEDLQRLQTGFGLMMLHNSILARKVIHDFDPKRETQAVNWIITSLRHIFPGAYRSEEIAEHLKSIKPDGEIRSKIAEFFLSVTETEEP